MNRVNWNIKGRIFDIQRFSIHDGDGIRTIVFLKGCSLRCKWCCNPESQNFSRELFFVKSTCISCGDCVEACKKGAISMIDGKVFINRIKCNNCGICTKTCCSNSLKIMGKNTTVKEVFDEIYKDKVFYEKSGGGVTLSGGEALLQVDFVKELLKACKLYGINTAIETAGNIKRQSYSEILKYTDLFLYDLKVMNSDIHKRYTGIDNEKILANIKFLSDEKQNIIVRVPFISSVNAEIDNIKKMIKFLKFLNIKEIHLLPYHEFGRNKYECLGREYEGIELLKPGNQQMEVIKKIINENGYKCVVKG